jgi:hypothetical protein
MNIDNLKKKAIKEFWNELEYYSWETCSPSLIIESIGVNETDKNFNDLMIYINNYHNKQKICSIDPQYTSEQVLNWQN